MRKWSVAGIALVVLLAVSVPPAIGQDTGSDKTHKLTASEGNITVLEAANKGSTKAQGRDWPYSYTGKAEVKTATLLSDKEVKVGGSWDVSSEAALAFGKVFKERAKDKLECSITCTLEEVKEGKAKVKLSVKMSVFYKGRAGGPGGRKERTIATTLPGHFLFDTAKGEITELSLSKSNIPVKEHYKNNYISVPSPGTGSIKVKFVASKAGGDTKKDE